MPHISTSVLIIIISVVNKFTLQQYFSPEADGPKKRIVRLYLDSFGQLFLPEDNAWDVVAFTFSETKDCQLFLRQDLQVEFGAGHKCEEEVKAFPLISYRPLCREGSIPCLNQAKKEKKRKRGVGVLNPAIQLQFLPCQLPQPSGTHSFAFFWCHTYLLIHPNGKQQRLKEAYRRIASSRAINTLLERWATHIQCMISGW